MSALLPTPKVYIQRTHVTGDFSSSKAPPSAHPLLLDDSIKAITAELFAIQSMLPSNNSSAQFLLEKINAALRHLVASQGYDRSVPTSNNSQNQLQPKSLIQRIDHIRAEIPVLLDGIKRPLSNQQSHHKDFKVLITPFTQISTAVESYIRTQNENEVAAAASYSRRHLSEAEKLQKECELTLLCFEPISYKLVGFHKQPQNVMGSLIHEQTAKLNDLEKSYDTLKTRLKITIAAMTSDHCHNTDELRAASRELQVMKQKIEATITQLKLDLEDLNDYLKIFKITDTTLLTMLEYQKASTQFHMAFLTSLTCQTDCVGKDINDYYAGKAAQVQLTKDIIFGKLKTISTPHKNSDTKFPEEFSGLKLLLLKLKEKFDQQYKEFYTVGDCNVIITKAPDISSKTIEANTLCVDYAHFNTSFQKCLVTQDPAGDTSFENLVKRGNSLRSRLEILQKDYQKGLEAFKQVSLLYQAKHGSPAESKSALEEQLENLNQSLEYANNINRVLVNFFIVDDIYKYTWTFTSLQTKMNLYSAKYLDLIAGKDGDNTLTDGALKESSKERYTAAKMKFNNLSESVSYANAESTFHEVQKEQPDDEIAATFNLFKALWDKLHALTLSVEHLAPSLDALAEGARIGQASKQLKEANLLDRSKLQATMVTPYAFNPKPNNSLDIQAHITSERANLDLMITNLKNEFENEIQLGLAQLSTEDFLLRTYQKSLQPHIAKLSEIIAKDTDEKRKATFQQHVVTLEALCPSLKAFIDQERTKLELVEISQYFAIQIFRYTKQVQDLRQVRKFEPNADKHREALTNAEGQFNVYSHKFSIKGLNTEAPQANESWDGTRFDKAYEALIQKLSPNDSHDQQTKDLAAALKARTEALWTASAESRGLVMPYVESFRRVIESFDHYKTKYPEDFTKAHPSFGAAPARPIVDAVSSLVTGLQGLIFGASAPKQ